MLALAVGLAVAAHAPQCLDPGFPTHSTPVYSGANLSAALLALSSPPPAGGQSGGGQGSLAVAVVCPLAEMTRTVGNVTLQAGQGLSIAGPRSAEPISTGPERPRLWGRFVVHQGALLRLADVEMREQAVAPADFNSPLLGAALWAQGSLRATRVSFRQLTTTVIGGAAYIASGGRAEFRYCLFDGNAATNGCSHRTASGTPYTSAGGGGALALASGAGAILEGCTVQGSRSGCAGGAIDMTSENRSHPFASNLTITASRFANNSAFERVGNDTHIMRKGDNHGAVPCPPPARACEKQGTEKQGTDRCCLDGDFHSGLNLTLPSA